MAVASYNLKREAKVYLVDSTESVQYRLDVSQINFSQTTTEESFSTKTLHKANNFEASIITKANPANFDFVFPALREDDLKVVFDRLLDYQTFHLYIATERDIFKLEKAVITNGDFVIERLRPLSLSISGQASKLILVGDVDSVSVPGTPQSRSSTRTYNRISHLLATLGGATSNTLDSGISRASITITNNIKWLPNDVIDSCGTESQSLTYLTDFIITNREFYGSIIQYITDTNSSQTSSYSEDTTLDLEVGEKVGGTVYGFNISINNCAYTNKIITGDIFTHIYDWRMVENPTALSNVISYITI